MLTLKRPGITDRDEVRSENHKRGPRQSARPRHDSLAATKGALRHAGNRYCRERPRAGITNAERMPGGEPVTHYPRLALILGSGREGRLCDAVAAWALGRLEAEGWTDIDVIDPARLDLSLRRTAGTYVELGDTGRILGDADAVLILTPEYNHSFTGELKFLIDSFVQEWQDKPVAFISYGGISGGLRAVEHLRSVFSELHAVAIRDTVSFALAWRRFGPDGTLRDAAEAELAFSRMIDSLRRWSTTLRGVRETATGVSG